jgi:Tfp pilus assembly protein PilO
MKENARAILLLALLACFAGTYFWIVPAETTIEATNAHAEVVLREASTDERALADEPRVRLLAQRIRNDLKGLRIRPSAGDTSQALLGDLQTAAARNRLVVVGVKPALAETAAQPPRAEAQASPNPFDTARRQDSDISVHGSYRDVVYFLRDLSRMPTLTRVLSVQLDRSNNGAPAGGTPSLDATVRVQTIRLDRTIVP